MRGLDTRDSQGYGEQPARQESTHPAPVRQIRAGNQFEGRNNTGSSRTPPSTRSPDPRHLAVLTRPGFVRAASRPPWHRPGQAALSFNHLLRPAEGGGLSPHTKQQRLTAHLLTWLLTRQRERNRRADQRWYCLEAMGDRENFDRVKEKHGPCASWAVWPVPAPASISLLGSHGTAGIRHD